MIAYLPLHKINALYDAELREAVGRVLDSGWYLKGEATRQFERDSVHHIFLVFCERRDELQAFLSANGIETQIHYPIPPHQQRCYQGSLGQSLLPRTERIHASELSIPCHQAMTDEDVNRIINLLNAFS